MDFQLYFFLHEKMVPEKVCNFLTLTEFSLSTGFQFPDNVAYTAPHILIYFTLWICILIPNGFYDGVHTFVKVNHELY